MAIRSEDLYLSIPNASPLFSKLAISSQFKVSLDLVRRSASGDNLGLFEYLTNCGLFNDTTSTSQKYDFLCSQASLPGAAFDVSEEMGSRQGMIERFASRRVYNQFDLTFYIDNNYDVLRMFEEWMNYINPVYNESNGRYDGSEGSQLNAYQERNTYSRFRYPDDYRRMISITKFERDFLQNPNDKNNTFKNMPLLTYRFIDTFPVDINAVQMSYDSSTFLQVTVVFAYLRHTIEKHGNAQQSVREKLASTNQLTQVNPLLPKRIGNEIRPSSTDPNPTKPVGFVRGEPYYGPFHIHKRSDGTVIKMVGAKHLPYPHAIIYDTVGESLEGKTTVTETVEFEVSSSQSQQQEQQQEQQGQQQDTTAPSAPTNLSVTSNATDTRPTVTGTAEANSIVRLFNGAQQLGSTTANANGSFSVTSSALSNDTYTFTLTATDAAGNVSNTGSITHTVNADTSGGQQGGGQSGGGQQGGGGDPY